MKRIRESGQSEIVWKFEPSERKNWTSYSRVHKNKFKVLHRTEVTEFLTCCSAQWSRGGDKNYSVILSFCNIFAHFGRLLICYDEKSVFCSFSTMIFFAINWPRKPKKSFKLPIFQSTLIKKIYKSRFSF